MHRPPPEVCAHPAPRPFFHPGILLGAARFCMNLRIRHPCPTPEEGSLEPLRQLPAALPCTGRT